MKIIGIYKIICLVNNKFYIGGSINIKRRFCRHKSELRHNHHPNKHLQRAWNKYGESNFSFEIIEEVANDLLVETEQAWLDNTECYKRKIGFNLLPNAHSLKGFKFTPTICRKISKKKAKKYIITEPDGKEYKISNLTNFCKENNLQVSLMARVASGAFPHHQQWKCRPAEVSFDVWNTKIQNLKKPNGNNKKWIITNPDKKEIIVANLTDFCKLNGLNYGNMAHVANGIQVHHKNWQCRPADISYEEWLQRVPNIRTWIVTNPDGKEIIVNNLVKFCDINKLRYKNLIGVAQGFQTHHKNWKCVSVKN